MCLFFVVVGISLINHEFPDANAIKQEYDTFSLIASHPEYFQNTNGTRFEPFGQEIDWSDIGQDCFLHTMYRGLLPLVPPRGDNS